MMHNELEYALQPDSTVTSSPGFLQRWERDERGQPDEYNSRLRTLSDQLIARGASDLEYLLKLKQKGWEDRNLDKHFAEQRYVADNSGPELSFIWYKRMHKMFGEIDRVTECIPQFGSFRFLDLGCCPGGFSSYILEKNREAIGVGISLPVEQGGHESTLEPELLNRFTLHLNDLTKYNLGINNININASANYRAIENVLGITNNFDLVLLDGHHLRTNTNTIEWEIDQLLLSQFIIALRYISLGGTLVIKLSIAERCLTAKIIKLFDLLSERLETVKPATMHAKRGSFYLVAHGVWNGFGAHQQQEFLSKLGEVWEELTFGGKEGTGRYLKLEDFDFVITTEELTERSEAFLDKLVGLGRNAWQGQIKGLEGLLRMENTKYRGSRGSRGSRGRGNRRLNWRR